MNRNRDTDEVKSQRPKETYHPTHSPGWPELVIALADSERGALARSPAWPSAGNPAHDAGLDMTGVPGSPLDTDLTKL